MTKKTSKHMSSLEEISFLPPPKVSFEFFPPKTPEMETSLWNTIKELEPFRPHFVSVTYGAGGSTRERTHQTVKRILDETKMTPAAHLTCVNATKDEIDEVARNYLKIGVKHIVALRGDAPEGSGKYKPYPGGYPYCVDLVKGLKKIGDFEISVAAFPEIHPEAVSAEADLDYLKKKIDAGANRAIGQYFFDPDVFLRFIDKARKKGIEVPIVPGIIMIANFKQLISFSKRCGASVPKWVCDILEGTDDFPDRRNILSAIIASEICLRLRKEGIDQFHFYTLNRATITASVCRALGIK